MPTVTSTSNKLNLGEHYYCVSYKELITHWLKKCIKISEQKPRVKETLSQYLHIVKDYTNQSRIMTSEIIELISKNKDYFFAIPEIANSYNLFRESVIAKIWQCVNEKKPKDEIIYKIDSISCIHYSVAEDNEGFYYGFWIIKEGVEQTNNKLFLEPLHKKCREINSNFKNSGWYIWTLSKFFFRIKLLDDEKIFELNDDIELNKFSDLIIDELNHYIDEIKKSYESDLTSRPT